MSSTDLSESTDGDSAGKDRPRPGSGYHSGDPATRHGATVWVVHGDKPVHGDVHQCMDGRDDKQRGHEPGGQTQRRVEYPLGTHGRRQRERHCQQAAEQVGDGQTAEEHVGASSHAAVTDDDDDDQRVTDDRDDHDGEQSR